MVSDLAVIFTLIFVAASLAIYGVYWVFVFNRREHKIINRRLDLSKRLDDSSVVLETLRRERGFRNDTNPILRQFSDWLTQTGIRVQRQVPRSGVHGALPGIDIDLQSDTRHRTILSLALAVLAAAAVMILYLARETQPTHLCFY